MKDRLTRRDLLALAATSGAALALPRWARAAEPAPPRRSCSSWAGPGSSGPPSSTPRSRRDGSLTLFNRGKSNPGLFKDRPLEEIHGDRNVADDLKKLAGRKWDAVIDTSGYFPRQVRSATEVLSGNVGQYVFISSISVYATPMKAGMDETSAVARLAAGTDVDAINDIGEGNYGALKLLCEEAAEKAMPGQGAQHPARLHRRDPRRERPLHLLAGPGPQGGGGPRPGKALRPAPVHRRPRPRRLDDPDGRCRGRTASSTRPARRRSSRWAPSSRPAGRRRVSATFTWAPEAKLKELGLTPDADFPIWVSTEGPRRDRRRLDRPRAEGRADLPAAPRDDPVDARLVGLPPRGAPREDEGGPLAGEGGRGPRGPEGEGARGRGPAPPKA